MDKRDAFGNCHPFVNILYFILVIGCGVILMHPITLAISFLCAFIYSIYLSGRKMLRFNILYMIPLILITAIMNPLFNRQGATILFYMNGRQITLESTLFGVATALMLVTVILWFTSFNKIMTSDKLIYLFGKIIPAMSLVLAMSLRFIPRFNEQIKAVATAQQCIGKDVKNGKMLDRARHGIKILSIMTTRAFEDAIETADSMKNRGYGLPGPTHFSIFKFDKRDKLILIFLTLCGGYILFGGFTGRFSFTYFPEIQNIFPESISLFAAYFALCAMPIFISIWEDMSSCKTLK